MKSSHTLLNCDVPPSVKPSSPSLLAQPSPNLSIQFINAPANNKPLSPLKAPKSYGTYSKQQQEQVIAFIRDGNSLRTAEKLFGIPKSTMHCWLKKITQDESSPSMMEIPSNQCDDEKKFSSDLDHPIATSEKISPKLPPVKPGGRGNKTPSPPPPMINSKPRTQIIIEEAELIRFLQTDEGADLICKAYGIGVVDFRKFVVEAKTKHNSSLRGVLVTPGKQQKVEVLGLLKNADQYTAERSNRKRVFNHPHHHGQHSKNHSTEVNLKKIKSEPVETPLTSLLKVANEKRAELLGPNPEELGLTPQQLIVASKLINEVGVDSVNTYLSTKPVILSSNQVCMPNTIYNPTLFEQKPPKVTIQETAELSPTYPKIVNPVSVKAEYSDFGNFVAPSEVSSPGPDYMKPIEVKPIAHTQMHMSATRPTISTNTNIKLNLNEINRTQSEKDLMALVDEDAVTADELCSDFNETLEVSSWVDNETWYMDQYLQHFQVSPANINKSTDNILETTFVGNTSMTNTTDNDFEDTGLTFSFNKNKTQSREIKSPFNKQQYLSIPDIHISPPDTKYNIKSEEKPCIQPNKQNKFESAFYRPITKVKPKVKKTTSITHRSAFSKSSN